MDDRSGSGTMSIYFDMRIGVIRDWRIGDNKNREIQKILKNKFKFFQNFYRELYRTFSTGSWFKPVLMGGL
jgi:hypothetical protein